MLTGGNMYLYGRSPPARGAWIEIFLTAPPKNQTARSPPARGAWIEILASCIIRRNCGSPPARGAWIEIGYQAYDLLKAHCRPPHGGRGLKSKGEKGATGEQGGRPPHGGRGLKSCSAWWANMLRIVAPRTGGVD